MLIKEVAATVLSSNSIDIIAEAIFNASSNPQTHMIISTFAVQSELKIAVKSLRSVLSIAKLKESNSFVVNFLNQYYMKYYPGYNSSFIAATKSNGIKQSVVSGQFQEILRQLAITHNVTELENAVCNAVTLNTTIVTASSSSGLVYSSGFELGTAAIAGITVGSFVVGAIIFYAIFSSFSEDERSEDGPKGDGGVPKTQSEPLSLPEDDHQIDLEDIYVS
jgi:hypothetical protein